MPVNYAQPGFASNEAFEEQIRKNYDESKGFQARDTGTHTKKTKKGGIGGGYSREQVANMPAFDETLKSRMLLGRDVNRYEANLENLKNENRSLLKSEAGMALEGGLKKTRENMSSRGLLYSGLRGSAEAGLKGNIASGLESAIQGSNRDIDKNLAAKKEAFYSVGMQSAQDALNRAREIQESQLSSAIARRQSLQQLGQVAGYAAGSYMGRDQGPSAKLTLPEIGSQYSQDFNRGYLGGNYSFGGR